MFIVHKTMRDTKKVLGFRMCALAHNLHKHSTQRPLRLLPYSSYTTIQAEISMHIYAIIVMAMGIGWDAQQYGVMYEDEG